MRITDSVGVGGCFPFLSPIRCYHLVPSIVIHPSAQQPRLKLGPFKATRYTPLLQAHVSEDLPWPSSQGSPSRICHGCDSIHAATISQELQAQSGPSTQPEEDTSFQQWRQQRGHEYGSPDGVPSTSAATWKSSRGSTGPRAAATIHGE